jgi:hypothetical protein
MVGACSLRWLKFKFTYNNFTYRAGPPAQSVHPCSGVARREARFSRTAAPLSIRSDGNQQGECYETAFRLLPQHRRELPRRRDAGAGRAGCRAQPVSTSSPNAGWTGGPNLLAAGTACGGPANTKCDNYKLTINPPSGNFQVEVTLTPQLVDDYDLEVYGPGGQLVGTSGNGAGTAEKVVLNNPAAGVYTVSAAPYVAVRAYNATAKLTLRSTPPSSGATAPTYGVYAPPAGMGLSAGEPTLGVNHRTGKVMYIAGTETLKVSFNDSVNPATATWQNVSAPQTSLITFDPILYTDPTLGRTFVSQLLPTKISLMAWTDDDGATWNPSMGAGINSGVDHQTAASSRAAC